MNYLFMRLAHHNQWLNKKNRKRQYFCKVVYMEKHYAFPIVYL